MRRRVHALSVGGATHFVLNLEEVSYVNGMDMRAKDEAQGRLKASNSHDQSVSHQIEVLSALTIAGLLAWVLISTLL